MKILRKNGEDLLTYAERISELYSEKYPLDTRKKRGQIFTPSTIGKFMVNLFNINKTKINILDPGAGTGLLTVAFCDKILRENSTFEIEVDLYESDENVIYYLKNILNECKKDLKAKGHKFKYNIFIEDFIFSQKFADEELNVFGEKFEKYDFVISNPPYFKLNKDSEYLDINKNSVYNQPNIYTLFMMLATNIANSNGELVFIVPRSFCSGVYYKKFRKWFLNKVFIENIHIFESRNQIFKKDKVLQENIIIKFSKGMNENTNIIISNSENELFDDMNNFEALFESIIYKKNHEIFIRVPSSELDLEILKKVDEFPNVLNDIGLKISTGPVVPFRAKEHLTKDINQISDVVPLLWIHNLQNMNIVWPNGNKKKEPGIIFSELTKKLLIPLKNYVLLSRFSSKEQGKRLIASPLFKSKFDFERIGIENHLNYIHREDGDLSEEEIMGISIFLNTSIIDRFFRSLNGNTQVNATEIRSIPLPSLNDIKKIGIEAIINARESPDKIVQKVLNIGFEC